MLIKPMIFTKIKNFILKVIVLFLRIIIFSLSKIITFKITLLQFSRIGGIMRTTDIFEIEKERLKNLKRVIIICVREPPVCNFFLSDLIERRIKKVHKYTYFFNQNKFFEYWFSSEVRFLFGKINRLTYRNTKPSAYLKKSDENGIIDYRDGRFSDSYYTDSLFDYDYVKKPYINLSYKEIGEENRFLNDLNLETKKWICIHNRDSEYLKNLTNHEYFKNMDFRYHNYRDSDVNNLIKSTKLLLEKNFYVFRMGRIQSNRMNLKHPNFIDYAFEKDRSDFNDIYLLSKCAAYLGSDSGPGDVTFLSGKPRFLMNYSLTMLYPFHPGGSEASRKNHFSFIFKHLFDKKTKKKLTLKQIINRNLMGLANGVELKREGVLPIENSEEEILDLTLEMINYLETKKMNSQDDYEAQKKFWDIYYENTPYKRFEDIPVRICSKFLSKNMYILE